ncbi:MAG: hypothetical protein QNJ14_19530 [Woeseiaceae bacterium]|nr:hypothetical protein [Woeseiaceae bacterium]
MKIKTLVRCESSDKLRLPAKDRGAAEKMAESLNKQPHVIKAELKEYDDVDEIAEISHVAKFQKGVEYNVPDRVGAGLVKLKYAEELD